MIHINEWDAVPWNCEPAQGRRPKAASQGVDAIVDALAALGADAPMAVHFYQGEGLRWIRVAFRKEELRQPADVRRVADAIRSALEDPADLLYFQALRAYDLLFFLEGGDPGSVGMATEYFGVPVDHVLDAWGLGPQASAAKASAPARGSITASPRRRIRSGAS